MMFVEFPIFIVLLQLFFPKLKLGTVRIPQRYTYMYAQPAHRYTETQLNTLLNRVYFENRSFSSSGSRWSLTQRRSAAAQGSALTSASKAATRGIRSSAVAWQ